MAYSLRISAEGAALAGVLGESGYWGPRGFRRPLFSRCPCVLEQIGAPMAPAAAAPIAGCPCGRAAAGSVLAQLGAGGGLRELLGFSCS